MATKITKEIYETYNHLSVAVAALDHKMPQVEADTRQAAFLVGRAKHELPKLLGYEDYDEFLEAIWEYKRMKE